MPFLKINGYTVPVSSATVKEVEERVGGTEEAFDGSYMVQTRGFRRRFSFKTKPMTEVEAEGLKGILLGKGDLFNTPDNYSVKGRPPTTSYDTALSDIGLIAADGAEVTDEIGDPYCKSIRGAAIFGTENNLLDADMQDLENDAALFNAIGSASVAIDTEHYLQGSQSLRVESTANGDGFDTDASSPGGTNNNVACFVFIKPDVSGVATIEMDLNTGTYTPSTIAPVEGGKWNCVFLRDTNAGITDIIIKVYFVGQTVSFYADCLMAYRNSTTNGPAAWHTGSGGNLALRCDDIRYMADATGYTIAFWLKTNYSSKTAELVKFSTGHLLDLSSGTLRYQTATGTDIIPTQALTGTGWKHIAITIRSNPETGEDSSILYVNGAEQTVDTYDARSLLRGATWVEFGDGSNLNDFSKMDDIALLPFALSADQVSGLYNSPSMGAPPFMEMGGDIIPEDEIVAVLQGGISSDMVSAQDAGAWRDNLRMLQFDLMESTPREA